MSTQQNYEQRHCLHSFMPPPCGLSAEQPTTAMRCHACGLDLLTAYNQLLNGGIVLVSPELCRKQEIRDAFTKLAIHGLPRETATTISAGIDMLVKRHNNESGLTKYKETIRPILKEAVDCLEDRAILCKNPERAKKYINLICSIEKILAEPS